MVEGGYSIGYRNWDWVGGKTIIEYNVEILV